MIPCRRVDARRTGEVGTVEHSQDPYNAADCRAPISMAPQSCGVCDNVPPLLDMVLETSVLPTAWEVCGRDVGSC